MRAFSLEVAGEYLLMAATLMYLKSRELLPTPTAPGQQEGEEVDPREELIRRLLEYQKYKEAAEHLHGRPVIGRNVWTRGAPVGVEEKGEAPLAEVRHLQARRGARQALREEEDRLQPRRGRRSRLHRPTHRRAVRPARGPPQRDLRGLLRGGRPPGDAGAARGRHHVPGPAGDGAAADDPPPPGRGARHDLHLRLAADLDRARRRRRPIWPRARPGPRRRPWPRLVPRLPLPPRPAARPRLAPRSRWPRCAGRRRRRLPRPRPTRPPGPRRIGADHERPRETRRATRSPGHPRRRPPRRRPSPDRRRRSRRRSRRRRSPSP